MYKRAIPVLLCFAVYSWADLMQMEAVYDDLNPNMTTMWIDHATLTEITTTDAYEGTKCLDFNYTLAGGADMAIYSTDWPSKTYRHGKWYKFFSFAYKISADNTKNDLLSMWCIHCDASRTKDVYFKATVDLQPTSSWQVKNVPTSIWATDPLDYISAIKFSFEGTNGATGHFYLDAIKFTNDTSATSISSPRNAARYSVPKGARIKADLFTLSGSRIASRIVEVSSNSADLAFPWAETKLRAGVYVVRPQVRNGEHVTLPSSGRLLLVKK